MIFGNFSFGIPFRAKATEENQSYYFVITPSFSPKRVSVNLVTQLIHQTWYWIKLS